MAPACRLFRPLTVPSDEMLRLDALRIIASVAIVVFHFKADLDVGAFGTAIVRRLQGLHAAVDLFFFLSGFVISRYYSGLADLEAYGRFVWKRLARLYPLHIATMLAFAALGAAALVVGFDTGVSDQADARCLPANLLLVHSLNTCRYLSFNQASWSISAEMLLYLCFPLVLRLRRSPPVALGVGITMLAIVASLGAEDRPWTEWTFDFGFVRAVPSFLLGAVAFDYRRTIARLPFAEPAMWGLLGLALALILVEAPGTLLVLILYGVALCGIAADATAPASPLVRWLAPWGTLTYSLYMLHLLVGTTIVAGIGRRLLHLSGAAMNLWVLEAVFLAFVLARLSYVWFETPCRLRMAGLIKNRPIRPSARPQTPTYRALGGMSRARRAPRH
jgi:peptidoglycan/LPS O-acetylase OafA/YrhL